MPSSDCCQQERLPAQGTLHAARLDSAGTGKMPNVQLQLQIISVPTARPWQGEGKVKSSAEVTGNTPNPAHPQLHSPPQQHQAGPSTGQVLGTGESAGPPGRKALRAWCGTLLLLPSLPAAGELCPSLTVSMLMYFSNFLYEISIKHLNIYRAASQDTSILDKDLPQHQECYYTTEKCSFQGLLKIFQICLKTILSFTFRNQVMGILGTQTKNKNKLELLFKESI